MTRQHEQTDANIRSVLRFGIGLFVLMIVALMAMWLLFSYLAGGPPPAEGAPQTARQEEVPPGPLLQVQPPAELRDIRAQEEKTLDSYGWEDREMGVVRLPIERAMELLVEREGTP